MARPLTVQEAAEQLGYHPDYVRQLLRAGRIKGEQIGQVWLIDRQEVERIKALQSDKGRLPKGFFNQQSG
jgi:excisionase family DNA binding protein